MSYSLGTRLYSNDGHQPCYYIPVLLTTEPKYICTPISCMRFTSERMNASSLLHLLFLTRNASHPSPTLDHCYLLYLPLYYYCLAPVLFCFEFGHEAGWLIGFLVIKSSKRFRNYSLDFRLRIKPDLKVKMGSNGYFQLCMISFCP